ncbi:MAG: glycosyltransferase family 4 protein, partial [Chloroflexota bacterium]
SKPRRHCMVVHAYYPLGEMRVQREALALVKHGYEVDVVCLRYEGEQSVGEVDGVKVHRVPMKRHRGHGLVFQLLEYTTFFFLALGRLLLLHRNRRYGTIQVHNPPDFLIYVALIPKLLGAKLIIDLHDLMPEFYADKVGTGMDSLPVRLVKWQERVSCRFADQVITVTEVWRKTLIRRGIQANKVNVVMNVADSRLFYRQSNEAEVTREMNGFKLVYHGTFTYRYGLDLMIRALDQVRRQIPDVHLTLLGNGDAREALVKLVKQLELEKHVYFSPRTHNIEQLPELIRQADVGIVANRDDVFTDTLLPTKMMEYIALGTPVIAARTSTIAAYFDDSMVQFFEPGDASSLADSITTLYDDPRRLAQLVNDSDRFNQAYRWNDIAASYVSLVDALN